MYKMHLAKVPQFLLLLASPRRGLVAAQDIAENESIAQPSSVHNVDLIWLHDDETKHELKVKTNLIDAGG